MFQLRGKYIEQIFALYSCVMVEDIIEFQVNDQKQFKSNACT